MGLRIKLVFPCLMSMHASRFTCSEKGAMYKVQRKSVTRSIKSLLSKSWIQPCINSSAARCTHPVCNAPILVPFIGFTYHHSKRAPIRPSHDCLPLPGPVQYSVRWRVQECSPAGGYQDLHQYQGPWKLGYWGRSKKY